MVVVAAACGDGGAGGDGRGPAITPTAGDRVMAYSAMLLAAQCVSIVATPRRWADDGEGWASGRAGQERERERERDGAAWWMRVIVCGSRGRRRGAAGQRGSGRGEGRRQGWAAGWDAPRLCVDGTPRQGVERACTGWVGGSGGRADCRLRWRRRAEAGASEHPQRQQATADRRGWWREGSGAKSSVAGCIAASGGGGERRTCCSDVGSTDLHPCCCVCACVCVCVFVCWCVWRR